MVKVRIATSDDRFDIIRLLNNFHMAGEFDFPFDSAWTSMHISNCIASKNGIIFVAHEDDEMVGVISGVCLASAFRPEHTCMEQYIWIEPKSRGNLHKLLVHALETWAKTHNCVTAQMSSQEKMRPNLVSRLFRMMGYYPIETVHSKSLV